jgi:hypothetical protein
MNLAPFEMVKLAFIGGIVNDELPNTLSPGTKSPKGLVVYIVTFEGFENILMDSQTF